MATFQTVLQKPLSYTAGVWHSASVSPVSYPTEDSQRFARLEAYSYWFQHRNRCLIAAMKRFPPNGAIWDVGGGNGAVAMAIQEAGIPVVLVEPSLEATRNAVSRGIRNVVCASWQDLELREDSIPAVGLFDVLEHIDDDHSFLRSLASALVPDGRVYLTVPAYSILWSQEDQRAGHYRRYSPTSLSRVLGNAGLRLEQMSPFFFWLPAPLFLLRTLPSLVGITVRATEEDHTNPRGILGRIFAWCMRYESQRMEKGWKMPLGTSLIAVARKVST